MRSNKLDSITTSASVCPCEVHGVPGVTERCEWVQTHGAPMAVRMNVQVERPLRTNFAAVGMQAGGAEHHRAHRHQAVRGGDDLQRRKVIAIVLDRRPDMAPLLAFELRLRGHHFDLGAERHHVLGEHLPHRHKVHFGHKFVPARVPFSDRTLVFFRHGQPLHCHPQLRLSTKLNAPPPAMLRLRHAEDRPPGCIHRDQGRGRAAALRSGAAGGVSLSRGEGLCRASDGAAVQGRAVEPDLHAGDAGAQIRAAAEAARKAAALGARRGSRVQGDPGARGPGLSGRRAGDLLRRRKRHRHGVLRDGLRRRPRVLESGDAGLEPPGARRGL